MKFYKKLSFRYFSHISEYISHYFGEVNINLKKARIMMSLQEYISIAIMSCFIIFLISFPILSFLFGLVFQTFLFSFISSFTVTLTLTVGTFILIMNYPRLVINEKAKKIDNVLPFAALYISTVASTKLPLHEVFGIFSRFSDYGELTKEIEHITKDVEVFGFDINNAIERAVSRSPSKELREMLWGMLSTLRAGGDMHSYLGETASNMMDDYRRKLYEFSHQLTIYIEVYLTTIVLGTIFFTILTSVISGMASSINSSNIIVLQFLLIFAFMPLVSILFIIMVKSITPGEE